MIKTVMIPMTIKVSQEEAFFLQAKGKKEDYLAKSEGERLVAESELNDLLNDGYSVLHAEKLEDSYGVVFAYQLYKPDSDERFHLTTVGRAALPQIESVTASDCHEQDVTALEIGGYKNDSTDGSPKQGEDALIQGSSPR